MAIVSAVNTRRVVGYRRVSTARQAGERNVSLPTQEARISAYVEREGFALVGSFTDVASGRKDDRQDYQRMLEFVRAGHADVIAVQFLDRFGRNPREILSRIWGLQEAGVEVVATEEDIREELVLLVRAGLAGAESKRTSERVTATMQDAAKRGRHSARPPYGYRLIRAGVGEQWEQDPDEAPIARLMASAMTKENIGYRGIAERLNAEGYPTRHGGPWVASTVRWILNNEALAGTLTYGKRARAETSVVRVENVFPAILDPEDWAALQKRLEIRKAAPRGQTHSSDHLLSGIARCGYCGGPMNGSRHHARDRVYREYVCARHRGSTASCAHNNAHLATKLEAAVLDYLGHYTDPERVRELLAAQATTAKSNSKAELAKAQRELAKLDDNLKRDVDLLGRRLLDESDFATVNAGRRERRTSLSETVERLQVQLAQEDALNEAAIVLPEQIRSFTESVQNMEPRLAKAELQTILKAIRVTREEIELEFRS